MGPTSIEWTERTWNPTTGCDRISAGCDHCYALSLAARLKAMGGRRYQLDGDPRTSGPGFGLQWHDDLVDAPRHWRKPSIVFVNSMSDLFHDRVPFEFIRRVFDTMEGTPRHTYQILTKRASRLLRLAPRLSWPANVWMGVSVEDQVQVERRARRLLLVPAAVRFLSCEPLIGPVHLGGKLGENVWSRITTTTPEAPSEIRVRGLDWVIVGGESGPQARPMDLNWARVLRDQCVAAGVPYFLKQLGGWPDKRGHDDALLDGRLWREMPPRSST